MPEKHTYGQILKSSAIIGGSSVINIGIGMVRTKAMAVILGPTGFGLMGLYSSILDLTQSIVGMGINSSGVRQIAEAVGTGDTARIAKTAQVLRRTSIFLGLLGAVFLFGFSNRLSVLTFNNDQHASGVALLSLAVFFNIVSAGQGTLIQGMRRIADLAKMGILGALYGALISIPVVYFFHEDGVVLSIILVSLMTLLTSWWYRRKIDIPAVAISSAQVGQEQAELLTLGFAFMSSGLMMTGAAYLIRIFIVRDIGFEAAGLYQSAWTLGGLYIGLILQAMGADFYPRLTAVVNNNVECNRIVNEQAHVSLLMAGPGVIATLTFAPLAIVLFYSSKFEGAIELLRWLCLGMTLRVVSWPMGFIIVAKNAQKLFFFSELAWTCVYLGLAWLSVAEFKLNGVGIAFFGSYIFHVVMIYFIVRRLSFFRWSAANIETSFFYLSLIAIIFLSFYSLPFMLAIAVGVLGTVLSLVYSIQVLLDLISVDRLPSSVLKILQLFRLTPKGSFNNNVIEKVDEAAIDFEGKKPWITVKRLLIIFMVITSFSMWTHWYEGLYDWLEILNYFKFLCNSLLSYL
ncbi:MAG: O-antigen translocase [Methylococcaceae bacterium]|nr:O-antigen translocase [Methylococcaceae bacterium]